MTSPRETRNEVSAGRKTSWLPPVYRAPLAPRRVKALDPARPALRMVTIALLTVLVTLLAIGVAWAVALP